jgi:glycosyltransferase involved in cell wall biosynthesis
MGAKKILFIYGLYSIHAEKRIKVFLNDPRFEVAVISRHDYSKNGINCFKLVDYRDDEYYSSKSKIFRGFVYLKQLIKHFLFIKKTIKYFNPDILFLQTLLYPAIFSFVVKKNYKIVITFWNGDVIWWAKWDFLEKMFKYQIVKKGIKSADLITVNSNVAKEACKKYYYRNEKIIVLPYPGVDRSIFHSRKVSKVDLLNKYNVNSQFVIFCPRGLAGYLNNDQILDALFMLVSKVDFIVIFIRGNASPFEFKNFIKSVRSKNLLHKVKVIDRLSPIEMSEVYSISDVTISMSSNDSLPNCMLESMSCGTAVLMGDIPQIREWIINEENGYLCEIGNAKLLSSKILKILNDKTFNDRIIANAHELIDNRANLQKSEERIKQIIFDLN